MSDEYLRISPKLGKAVTERWINRGMTPPDHSGLPISVSVWGNKLPEFNPNDSIRHQRWRAIANHLEECCVLSQEQLIEYFQADQHDLGGMWCRKIKFCPVHGRDQIVTTLVYATHPSHLDYLSTTLGRRIALSEMRLRLKGKGSWSSYKDEYFGDRKVDAESIVGDRRIAVIYDSGTYPTQKVSRRIIDLLKQYTEVKWIVPASPKTASTQLEHRRNRFQALKNVLSQDLTPDLLDRVQIIRSNVWTRYQTPQLHSGIR